ncbi:tRNA (adenine(58)-N(1))-methyltransferase, mitochondrial [Hyla sarda]|uniref:tRNA (adenine(58)-N(1))-methyltransferase, mitochondrial n=1 Tax=Hyla sarda TaxID=327740 RepID=UPI0024C2C95E|nr:tRNA (adenine(58)-N(1))-methyltransferase, mitochondrial [Hyla sarda]
MSALCARKMLRPAALWCRAPPAGSARNLLTRRIKEQLQHCIKCCSDSQEGQGRGGQPEAPKPINPLGVRTWRKRRPLSPLDRVSLLIPPEYISQEIKDLQNPEQLGPPSSSSQDHPEKASPPELSSTFSQDHQEQLKPSQPPSSSFQDHPEQLKPSQPPSSSFQDHREQLKPSQPPSSSFQDHPEQLSQPPSSSFQDHPEQLKPSQPPSSSFQDHREQLKSSQPPSSSFQDHPEQLKPSQPPSSSFQDHPEQLSPPEPSSSCEDHLNHPQPPSFFQETDPLGQLPDPEPSPSPNNAPQELYDPSKTENPATLQGMPFQPQDLLIAEFKRRHYSMFRKMFVLKNSGKLVSNWGAINYQDLLGRLPGEKIRTTTGHQFLVRRPSLDEYVIYMKRGPTISYPKDVASMLTMMDVNPGDVILEAGSGSGALSLFLSRAVGPEGRVHSIEVRSDHHQVSRKNFLKWKTAWEIRSGRSWPDNVNFINKDVRDVMSDLQAVGFDAVALDMLNPHVALPAIIGNLKQGAVCAVYITNITQVIDLLEGIRSCELPLLCEKVMEVSVTDWLVAPSLRKDGRVSKRVEPQWKGSSGTLTQEQRDDEDDDESQTDDDDFAIESQPFGQVPYIARPMPWQIGHTAFLVQLRKFKPAAELTEQTDTS